MYDTVNPIILVTLYTYYQSLIVARSPAKNSEFLKCLDTLLQVLLCVTGVQMFVGNFEENQTLVEAYNIAERRLTVLFIFVGITYK